MQSTILLKQRHEECVEIIQFTDTHIFSDPAETFDGVDTTASLQKVINHAKQYHWPPDAIFVTGDLVHDPVPASYRQLRDILTITGHPVFCIPGNHDDPSLMYKEMQQGNIHTSKTVQFSKWLVLMLDTFIPGTHAGQLQQSELVFLEHQLNTHKQKHVLICLHHPPVSIGSPWMDDMGLRNPDAFFSIVDKYNNVRVILWGHIHQEFNSLHNQVKLLATPSTCVQFMPKADSYIRDMQSPGYRILKLFMNGDTETEVVRAG
jgi:3',5'-cyclic-AMP phosphodiesterase